MSARISHGYVRYRKSTLTCSCFLVPREDTIAQDATSKFQQNNRSQQQRLLGTIRVSPNSFNCAVYRSVCQGARSPFENRRILVYP